jgi:hypothetical protein
MPAGEWTAWFHCLIDGNDNPIPSRVLRRQSLQSSVLWDISRMKTTRRRAEMRKSRITKGQIAGVLEILVR